MGNLISVAIEATKIKEENIVDNFIGNINTDFCKLEKIHKKSGYGCLLKTRFAELDEIRNSEELKCILDQMIHAGFKAHDAKNNYMEISCQLNDISASIMKKVDIFVSKQKSFCQKFARKEKVFKFDFNEKLFDEYAKENDMNSPLKWDNIHNIVSFSFFRSTLKFETIMASAEYSISLFNYIKSNNISYEQLFDHFNSTFDKYIDFACENYPFFKNYFKEKFKK